MSLARQFLIAGCATLLAGMLAIGVWVTDRIEDGVTRNTATATALYVDSVIAPLLTTIRPDRPLSEGVRRALDEVTTRGGLGARIASFKLWQPDGAVVYSSRQALIGQTFPLTENLKAAFGGLVVADFDDLSDDEDALEKAENRPLLEIYSPVREPWSGRVVAVAEFYEIADELEATLADVRLQSWLVVAGVTAAMLGLLFVIVLRGSRLIARQRTELERRVEDLSRLLGQNEALRRAAQSSSSRAVALNERYLKRVSADLHDGPAQLLALASLRIGSALDTAGASEAGRIRDTLDEAMKEIRDICSGLALPRIEGLALGELLTFAVDSHKARTGTEVRLQAPGEDWPLTPSQRICVYRFVQEGLNNAFRHAGGAGQSVTAALTGGGLRIEVADTGPGFDVASDRGQRLGVVGLRERVESLGGAFGIASDGTGTRLTMTFTAPEMDPA